MVEVMCKGLIFLFRSTCFYGVFGEMLGFTG